MSCKVGIPGKIIHSLDQTVDYAEMLKIIQKHFSHHAALLETLASQIEQDVKSTFSEIVYFYISIRKMHPALPVELESSEIVLEKKYS